MRLRTGNCRRIRVVVVLRPFSRSLHNMFRGDTGESHATVRRATSLRQGLCRHYPVVTKLRKRGYVFTLQVVKEVVFASGLVELWKVVQMDSTVGKLPELFDEWRYEETVLKAGPVPVDR